MSEIVVIIGATLRILIAFMHNSYAQQRFYVCRSVASLFDVFVVSIDKDGIHRPGSRR